MPLRITVLPASTQAGRETIRALLLDHENEIQVHAIYRDPSKAPADFIQDQRFSTGKGDVTGTSELDLNNPDAVFYIPPPTYDGTDTAEHARNSANKVKAAIDKAASVKRLIILSAPGAQHDKGVGILVLNHITDNVLSNSAPEVLIARPIYFQEGWASALKDLEGEKPVFNAYLTPVDHKVEMVSTHDIGRICAQKLRETGTALPTRPSSFKIFGPRSYSAVDVRDALEEVTGKTIEINAILPEQLVEFFGKVMPLRYAEELAEMVAASNRGGIIAEEMKGEDGVWRGSVELVDTLRRVAGRE